MFICSKFEYSINLEKINDTYIVLALLKIQLLYYGTFKNSNKHVSSTVAQQKASFLIYHTNISSFVRYQTMLMSNLLFCIFKIHRQQVFCIRTQMNSTKFQKSMNKCIRVDKSISIINTIK